MHDNYISQGQTVAWLLWAKTVFLVGVVWALAIVGVPVEYVIATGVLAILSLGIAAVWHIRLFNLRVCTLVRVANGLETPSAEIRSIKP